MEVSNENLKTGLDIIGKHYFNIREWTGRFAEQQHKHEPPPQEQASMTKFGKAINEQLLKWRINQQTCILCLSEKPKHEFYHLSNCHHRYCYSCLNSYTISRIQALTPIVCPNQNCPQLMTHSSPIYKFLPDNIKLKYLRNRNKFKGPSNTDNICQRCLEVKHSGECKYHLVPEFIEESFKYRQCPNCKIEIRMTEGRRKVTCLQCEKSLCYMCGQIWPEHQKHECRNQGEVKKLQNELGYSGCDCSCCDYSCECDCSCPDCSVGQCCDVLFYCGQVSIGCIFCNLFSIPIRLILTAFMLFLTVMKMAPVIVLTFFWLLFCLIAAIFVIPLQLICERGGWEALVMVILYPITVIYSYGIALCETSSMVTDLLYQSTIESSQEIGSMWVEVSPKKCCAE